MSFLTDQLKTQGRLPPIQLAIQPLYNPPQALPPPFYINRFLSYEFESSVLVPVDSFRFTTVMPDDINPITHYTNEGDIVTLSANGNLLCTGMIDRIDVEFDATKGELVTISGRNLMAQLEDQDAVSLDSIPFYGGLFTPTQVLNKLITDTRIQGFVFTKQAPVRGYNFATEPGESKLQALTRYMDVLNCLAWMNPQGQIVFGRPNMAQGSAGNIFCIKSKRVANVSSIRASRNSTSIPNIIVPIWAGQETVQARVGKEQILYNKATGPSRLRNLGFRLPKCTVVSSPDGAGAQELPLINQFTVAGSGDLLQAQAKRDVARANVRELEVEAIVPGHYNDDGHPFLIDQVYTVTYDRGDVAQDMYLHTVSYSMDPEAGQKTSLHFCKKPGTIVSDVVAP